jgi:polar amino acid transport system substrate-binding protein
VTLLRTLVVVAGCALALALAACDDSGSSSSEPQPPAAAPAEPAQPAESEPADTGAAEPAPPPAEEPPPQEAPETLVVALNLPSPGFQVGAVDGEDVVFAKGFEVDLVRALAKKLGTQARFVQVEPFGDLLAAGRKPWDLAVAEVTITDKRDRRVDFSDPYLLADQGVLLRKGLEQVPTSIADLQGLLLCTQDGTTASSVIRNRIEPDEPAQRFSRLEVLFRELQAGACDAAVLDAPILGAERAQLPFRYGPLAGLIATGEQYGIVFPRRSPLREAINGALAELVDDGTLARLSKTWLSTDLSELPLLE